MNEKEYVLITGASSGIGSHLAMHFAESSYSLLLLARRKELLHEVKEKCLKINSKISVETFVCDVTKDEDLQKVQNFVNENNLTLKIVIANAGIPVQGYVSKLKVEGFDSLIRDTSSNAIVNTSKSEFQLYMKRVKSREEQGDKLRNVCKEINSLKKEFREIKSMLTKVIDGS